MDTAPGNVFRKCLYYLRDALQVYFCTCYMCRAVYFSERPVNSDQCIRIFIVLLDGRNFYLLYKCIGILRGFCFVLSTEKQWSAEHAAGAITTVLREGCAVEYIRIYCTYIVTSGRKAFSVVLNLCARSCTTQRLKTSLPSLKIHIYILYIYIYIAVQ